MSTNPSNAGGTAPKVSVLMSVYNGGRYLREAMDSVLSQSYVDFEFIVIDDCSTDGSLEVVEEYAAGDERVVPVRNPENIGLTRSLNKGLAMARGEYVARQDADDVSMPDRLSIEVGCLDAQEDAVLVTGNMLRLNGDGNIKPMLDRTMPSCLVAWNQVFRNMVSSHSAVMFRKEAVLELGGYNEGYRYSQDFELWSRLMDKGRFVILPDILLKWREHPENISAKHGDSQKELGYKVVTDTVERISGVRLDRERIDIIRRLLYGRYFTEHRELCSVISYIDKVLMAKAARDRSLGLFGKADVGAVKKFMASRLFESIRYVGLSSVDRCKLKLITMMLKWDPCTGLRYLGLRAGRLKEKIIGSPPKVEEKKVQQKVQPPEDAAEFGPRPKVSVVITCYNYGRFLAECVQSVLAQTYRDFEIIIVNDGSTDDTAKVAEEIVHSNPDIAIRVFNINNVGFPESRNIGIREASGDYIMPLDADDKLEPDYLEETVRVLDERQDVAVAYTGLKNFGNLTYWQEINSGRVRKYDPQRLKKSNIICGCSLFRRSAWEHVGGYKTRESGLDGFYDWEFWIALAKDGLTGIGIDKPLYLYRTHGPSRMDIAEKRRRTITRQIRYIHRDFFFPGLYRAHPALASMGVFIKSCVIEPFTHYLYRKSPGLHGKLRGLFMSGEGPDG